MNRRLMFIVVLAGLAFAVAPGAGADSRSLIGTWQCGASSLVFPSDTVLVFDGERLGYRRAGNVLRVQEEDGPVDYPYVLSGDRLVVTFPDGSRLSCQRSAAGSPGKGAPPAPSGGATGAESQLRGMLCQWAGSSGMSSSYSRSTRVWFDGAGRFSYSRESSFSGDAGSAYGGGPGQGGSYRVKGNVIHLTFGDGSTGTAQVKMRQNNGRITEFLFNGELYATGLCE